MYIGSKFVSETEWVRNQISQIQYKLCLYIGTLQILATAPNNDYNHVRHFY